jgi:hypothetical protein
MSETQPVRITGGTFFIGLMVWLLLLAAWDIRSALVEIRDRLPPKALDTKHPSR